MPMMNEISAEFNRAQALALDAENKALMAEIERLRAALRSALCPGGGFNGMPKDAEPTVGLCLDHGVCGCDLGAAIAPEQSAPKKIEAELDRHAYVPSMVHMGDCQICGHLQGAAIHSIFRRR